jgi:phosphomannomutase
METNMKTYIFDVDGTLTPSRDKMDEDFKSFFMSWCRDHIVYLVTGSDQEKTIEQVGEDLYSAVNGVFNCAGNAFYVKNRLIYTRDLKLTHDQISWLLDTLELSKTPYKTGNHIEFRLGMVNFSTVGRNANREERAAYVVYDEETNERFTIAQEFNEAFPELEATVAGETGLDIYSRGYDKAQVIDELSGNVKDFVFFGDKICENGNDLSLAQAIGRMGGSYHNVDSWKDTYDILKNRE